MLEEAEAVWSSNRKQEQHKKNHYCIDCIQTTSSLSNNQTSFYVIIFLLRVCVCVSVRVNSCWFLQWFLIFLNFKYRTVCSGLFSLDVLSFCFVSFYYYDFDADVVSSSLCQTSDKLWQQQQQQKQCYRYGRAVLVSFLHLSLSCQNWQDRWCGPTSQINSLYIYVVVTTKHQQPHK